MTRMVDVEGKIHWETEKAWLFSTDGEKANAQWVPKVVNGEELVCDEAEKGYAIITMPQFLAEEKGFV